MRTEVLEVESEGRTFVDLSAQVRTFAEGCDRDGLINIFVPHATAGLALMEIGSGSEQDLEAALHRLLPKQDIYDHRHGSLGHGRDHVVPAFVSPSMVVPVVGGRVELGTWQSIVLVDTNADNPQRKVRLSFLPATA